MCPDTGEEQGRSGPIVETTPEHALGARIRAFRQLRQLSVRGLAAEVGASPGFLSQLERGQVNASVSMLRRIAGALGLTVADLFDERDGVGPRVLRRDERPALATPPLARKYLVSRKPLRSIEAYAGEFEPGGSTGDDAYTHGEAWELFLVIAGDVLVELDGVEHRLGRGDSIEYPTSLPHRASNLGDSVAEVLWVISPPTTR